MPEKRGSERIAGFGGHGGTIPEDTLKQIQSLAETEGVTLIDWWWRGQPAVDIVGGTFQADPRSIGNVVTTLATMNDVRLGIRVFPYGIVNPEVFHISFASQGGVKEG